MKFFAMALVSMLGMGAVACANQDEGDATDTDQGALEQGGARCGSGSGRRTAESTAETLASRIDAAKVKLAASPRDPAAVPVGARNVKYLTALELKQDGKFSAKLNTGAKLKGTFTLSAPRCRANFEMLTLDPTAEDDADGLYFKVVRGHDPEAPNRYSFVPTGEGWTVFNMTIDAPEPATPEASCNCDDLPKPRCFGAYVCEENACVWRSPVGGPRCGG